MHNTPSNPTLNAAYNDLLVRWSKSTGEPQSPECENCGCDLTGKEVHETPYDWRCAKCYEDFKNDPSYGGPSDEELRREEARQLGLSNF